MECNKDEAVRAKEIAENRLLKRDINGAKKFALKAQNLFPELDGLSQFLEIIDVYVAHEKKINGVTDYYGIFGVDPTTDEDILKKQYKRMALSLHPDKNKSVGADGAFKIMSQGWSVLSDKDKRSAYDLALNIGSSYRTSSFATSSANCTPPANYPLHVPTQSTTAGTSTGQSCSSASQHPRNTVSSTQNIQTPACSPAAATGISPSYTPAPHQSRNSTPADVLHNGSRRMKVPNFQQSKVTPMQFQTSSVPPRPRNTAPLTGNPSPVGKFGRPPLPDFHAQYVPTTPGPPFFHQNVPTRNQMPSSNRLPRPETFWTLCNKCKVHYEYQNIYLNQNILCHRCKQPFLAAAMLAPSVKTQSSQETPTASPPVNSHSSQEIPAAAPPSASRTSQSPLSHPPKKKFEKKP